MKIAIACDHGGFPMKATVVNVLMQLGHELVDLGAYTTTRSTITPTSPGTWAKRSSTSRPTAPS